jgi:hypothetical protein
MITEEETLKKFDLAGKIKDLLVTLKEKEQKVLTSRCGLSGSEPKTLESIGKNLSLTRERIRQIEKRAFEKMATKEVIQEKFEPIYNAFNQLFEQYGGLLDQQNTIKILSRMIDQNEKPLFGNEIKFLLRASGYKKIKKSKIVKSSWTNAKKFNQALLEKVILEFENILKVGKKIIPTQKLIDLFKDGDFYKKQSDVLLDNLLLGMLYVGKRLIKEEDEDRWGLDSWPLINPKTIHDWTYYVVKRYGKPIHFTKIGDLIKNTSRRKKFNIKTVHNVLIADRRFVLVGNGLYALSEWGYEPGTVLDVIKKILGEVKKPLTSQEITARVLERRQVKPNTVLVNLQNRDEFKRVARATYALVTKSR